MYLLHLACFQLSESLHCKLPAEAFHMHGYKCVCGSEVPAQTSDLCWPQALMSRMHEIVDAAGAAGVNVLCLQEAWTMPFACAP